MKRFTVALSFLFCFSLLAQTNWTVKPSSNSVVIVIVTDSVTASSLVSSITNILSWSPKIRQMETAINLEQQRIDEVYSDLPKAYGGPSGENTQKTIDMLQKLWSEHDASVSNLNVRRVELKKIKENYGK